MGRAGRVFGGGTDPVSIHYREHKARIKARTMAKYGTAGGLPPGATDVQARGYAGEMLTQHGIHSPEFVGATTFINKSGERVTRGSFQVLGYTLASLQGLMAPLAPPEQPKRQVQKETVPQRLLNIGMGRAAMGGMGRGEWERPQIKKEEAKTAGPGIGTVVAVGGIGYILWALLR